MITRVTDVLHNVISTRHRHERQRWHLTSDERDTAKYPTLGHWYCNPATPPATLTPVQRGLTKTTDG